MITLSAREQPIDTVNIAVSDFRALGLPQTEAEMITEKVRGELLRTKVFAVMERNEMKSILMEQEFQETAGVCDQSCIVEMGQLLGVRYIVAGTVGKVGKLLSVGLKMIDLQTGKIILTEDEECECPVEELFRTSVVTIADNLAETVRQSRTGTLLVASQPDSATVTLEGAIGVRTPAEWKYLVPGDYTLTLSLYGCETVHDTVTIEKGRAVERAYILERTAAWTDSVTAAMRVDSLREVARKDSIDAAVEHRKKVRRNIRRIVFGVVGAGIAGMGYFYDGKVADAVENQRNIRDVYLSDRSPDWPSYKTRFDTEQKRADDNALYRNSAYMLAGLFGIGFVISIPF